MTDGRPVVVAQLQKKLNYKLRCLWDGPSLLEMMKTDRRPKMHGPMIFASRTAPLEPIDDLREIDAQHGLLRAVSGQ
jgi:hypothetical protein